MLAHRRRRPRRFARASPADVTVPTPPADSVADSAQPAPPCRRHCRRHPAARRPTPPHAPAAPTAHRAAAVGIAGVNDPQCRSDAPPVVLLHGTFSTVASNFSAMAPALQSSGRCVYALGYGSNGTGPVRDVGRAGRRLHPDGAERHRRRSGRRRRVLAGRPGAADRAARRRPRRVRRHRRADRTVLPRHGFTAARLASRPACARPARTSEPGPRCSPNWPRAATWTATCATRWSPPARTRWSPRSRRRSRVGPADRVRALVRAGSLPGRHRRPCAPAGRPDGDRLDGRGAGRTWAGRIRDALPCS